LGQHLWPDICANYDGVEADWRVLSSGVYDRGLPEIRGDPRLGICQVARRGSEAVWRDANFANESVGCHTPLGKRDFVYTLPIKAQSAPKQNGTEMFNQGAELTGDLPADPLEWRVITSALNQQNSTMSTLFGNDSAVGYRRTRAQHDYPAGSTLSLVTWTEREDPRWFGARIPATPKSVEFVTVSLDAAHRPLYSYQDFEGSPLKKTQAQESSLPNERAAYLLAQPAAVMP
jgi:hypothetical protein